MDRLQGYTPPEKLWDPEFFSKWGQTIGQLHRLAQGYPSWQAATDPQTGAKFLTWREEWQGFHNWCPDSEVKRKWAEIKQQLELLPVTRQSFGFIHNDPHIHSPELQKWKTYFTDHHKTEFKQLYSDLLIALGYETNYA